MKERLINNLGLKILSLFLAFFVWLLVVNVSNPEVTSSKEVTLDIENAQVLLNAGRTYEISGKSTVSVTYEIHTLDEYKVRATDFRAYIDLAELYDVTGSVAVKVEVLNNKQIIRNASAKPGVIRVKTEELQVKEFQLAARTQGSQADGYAVNGISLDPMYVTVEGPISQVGMINYAGVEIALEGRSESFSGATTPVFYDANGNPMEDNERITTNVSEIGYNVTINKIKNLPLDFAVSGTAAPGYRYTGVECGTKSIAVSGLVSNLASLNTITIPGTELNVDGATGDKVVTVDIREFLPDGVTLAGTEEPLLEIRMKVEPLTTRTKNLSETDITLKNMVHNMNYRITPNRMEVSLRGLADDLDSLSGEDLRASIDVEGLQPGVYEMTVTFESSEVFTVLEPLTVQLEISSHVMLPGGTSAHETSASDETDSSESQSAGQDADNIY